MPTNADRTADYKGFTFSTFKTPNGSWRAIITKADGSKIKAAGQKESSNRPKKSATVLPIRPA